MEGPQSTAYQAKKTQPLRFDRYSLRLEAASSDPEDCDADFGSVAHFKALEFGEFVRVFNTSILGHYQEEEAEVLGHLIAQLVLVSDVNVSCEDLYDVMGAQSQALADIHDGIYGDRNLLLEADKDSDDIDHILHISEVCLKSEYRGYGIGLLAVDAMIQSLSILKNAQPMDLLPCGKVSNTASNNGVDENNDNKDSDWAGEDDDTWDMWTLVLLSPAGLDEPDLRGPGFDEDLAVEKLEKHWGKLGFSVLGRDVGIHRVLMALETAYVRPRIEEVVPHLVSLREAE